MKPDITGITEAIVREFQTIPGRTSTCWPSGYMAHVRLECMFKRASYVILSYAGLGSSEKLNLHYRSSLVGGLRCSVRGF